MHRKGKRPSGFVASQPARGRSCRQTAGYGEVAARWLRQLRRMAACGSEATRRREEGGPSCSRTIATAAAACCGIGHAGRCGCSGRLCVGELPRQHLQWAWHSARAPQTCALGGRADDASGWNTDDADHADHSDFDRSRGAVASSSSASDKWRTAGTCGGDARWLAYASSGAHDAPRHAAHRAVQISKRGARCWSVMGALS